MNNLEGKSNNNLDNEIITIYFLFKIFFNKPKLR